MRKINKIINIALIFMLTGVFLFRDLSYSSSDSSKLRPALQCGSLAKEAPNKDTLASNEELFLKGKKILIVQDYPTIVFLDKNYCIERGAEKKDISAAGDYETAINALDKNKFDVIILDMGFPMKEGRIEERWAGLSVLEYMVSYNVITPVLIDSSRVETDLHVIHRIISENPGGYPNLARLGRDNLDKFLGIFPPRFRDYERSDYHFRALLQADLEGLRASSESL